MNQYCRYCQNLVVGDAAYCEAKDKVIQESTAKSKNTCKEFRYWPMDAFRGEPDALYSPRIPSLETIPLPLEDER